MSNNDELSTETSTSFPKLHFETTKLILKRKGDLWKPDIKSTHLLLRKGYTIGPEIYRGFYSVTKRGKLKNPGSKDLNIVVKIFNKLTLPKDYFENCLQNEIKALETVHHQSVIQALEAIETRNAYFIIFEYMDHGDLRNYVNSQKFLTEIEARRIFRQLVDATDACHCHGVCHRDIKLDNIFVDENENIKLGDFGFAAVGGDLHRLREHRGSYVYAAPEVLNQQEYDGFQADIWSLGVCLYAMVCGRLPFTNRQDPQEFLEAVSLKVIFTKKVTKACRDIVRRMLNPVPEKRPTLKDIRRSNWFSQPFKLPTTDRLSVKPFCQFTPPIIGAEHGYFQNQKYHREPSLNYVTSVLTYVAKQARSKIRTDIKSTKPLSEIYGIKGPVCQRIVEKLKEKEAAKSKRRSLLSLPTEEIDNSVIDKRRESVVRDLRALRYSTGGRIAQLARKEHRQLMAQTKIRNESRIQKGFRWKLLVSKIKQERIEKWCRLCALLLAQAEVVKENKS